LMMVGVLLFNIPSSRLQSLQTKHNRLNDEILYIEKKANVIVTLRYLFHRTVDGLTIRE